MEEHPEDPYNQGMLNYIKKLYAYVLDIAATILGLAQDAEALDQVLGKDIDRTRIRTEKSVELWSKAMEWTRNMVQYGKTYRKMWNWPRRYQKNPQSPP